METVSLTANMEKVREEATNARAELDKLQAPSELVAEEHRATLIKVHKKRQGELDSLRATAWQRRAAIAEVCEGT